MVLTHKKLTKKPYHLNGKDFVLFYLTLKCQMHGLNINLDRQIFFPFRAFIGNNNDIMADIST